MSEGKLRCLFPLLKVAPFFCLNGASVVEVNVAGKRFTYSGCGNTGEGGAGMSWPSKR